MRGRGRGQRLWHTARGTRMPSLPKVSTAKASARSASPSQRSDRKKAGNKKVAKKKKAGKGELTPSTDGVLPDVMEEEGAPAAEDEIVTADTPDMAKDIKVDNQSLMDITPSEPAVVAPSAAMTSEEATGAAPEATPAPETAAETATDSVDERAKEFRAAPSSALKTKTICASYYKPSWHRMLWSGHIQFAPRALLTGPAVSVTEIKIAATEVIT